jgi:putative hydrolase of the HAD superfamily
MTTRTLIWDFDGTLGYREGGAWTASLLEVLDREAPGHGVTLEQLRPFTRSGFPWQAWEAPHPHLAAPEAWWAALLPVFERAYEGVGLDAARARDLARRFRAVYLAPERWRRFDDALPTLRTLAARGWTHVLLSNHAPELNDLLAHLELTPHFAQIFNSAEIGYEKPHPAIFHHVLDTLPTTEAVWMIGDSFHADVQGAQGVGIPAILVHRFHPEAQRYCETLAAVAEVLEGEEDEG